MEPAKTDPAPPAIGAPAQGAGKYLPRVGLALGIGGCLGFVLFGPAGLSSSARCAAGVAILMAAWWLTEAVSIYWTSLLPLALYPLLHVFPGGLGENLSRTALPYVDDYIFLFLGGMCIAGAMERWNLHKRIALHIMHFVGARGDRLLLGFLVATAFVSLWISNTATAVMMMPIGLAVLHQLESDCGSRLGDLGAAVMLAIAYGANVGGIGTKIGTAPNAILCGYVEKNLGRPVSFLDWVAIGFPFVLLFIPLTWLVLRRVARADLAAANRGKEALEREIALLGPVRRREWIVAGVFVGAALLWIFGQPLARALGLISKTYEAAVALLAALALYASGTLDWAGTRRIPWKTLLLLGGGFALAAGIEGSGLSKAMGAALSDFGRLHGLAQMFAASVITVAVSAAASNTATINIMLPILHGMSGGSIPLLSAATIASSCDFMLPAGTPPNAIVFGSGYLTVPRMARVGFVLDLAAALLVAAWAWFGLTRWLA